MCLCDRNTLIDIYDITYSGQKLILTRIQISDRPFEVIKYAYHSTGLNVTNTMMPIHFLYHHKARACTRKKTVLVRTAIFRLMPTAP